MTKRACECGGLLSHSGKGELGGCAGGGGVGWGAGGGREHVGHASSAERPIANEQVLSGVDSERRLDLLYRVCVRVNRVQGPYLSQ